MTKALRKAFEAASRLPDREQEELAAASGPDRGPRSRCALTSKTTRRFRDACGCFPSMFAAVPVKPIATSRATRTTRVSASEWGEEDFDPAAFDVQAANRAFGGWGPRRPNA